MLKSQARRDAEDRRRDAENTINWSKDIREFVNRTALCNDAADDQLKVCKFFRTLIRDCSL